MFNENKISENKNLSIISKIRLIPYEIVVMIYIESTVNFPVELSLIH